MLVRLPEQRVEIVDLFSDDGETPDSTGLYTNGALPTSAGSIDLTSTGTGAGKKHK